MACSKSVKSIPIGCSTHLAKVKTATGFDLVRSAPLMEANPDDCCRCLQFEYKGNRPADVQRHLSVSATLTEECTGAAASVQQPACPLLVAALTPSLVSNVIIATLC